mmetsp:Transcript_63388/g.151287  ORF Transcript_63388/g.151287 Transcript_63388/m.151287 type:complete len:216 (-) Transcript_63388:1016-1663(-)
MVGILLCQQHKLFKVKSGIRCDLVGQSANILLCDAEIAKVRKDLMEHFLLHLVVVIRSEPHEDSLHPAKLLCRETTGSRHVLRKNFLDGALRTLTLLHWPCHPSRWRVLGWLPVRRGKPRRDHSLPSHASLLAPVSHTLLLLRSLRCGRDVSAPSIVGRRAVVGASPLLRWASGWRIHNYLHPHACFPPTWRLIGTFSSTCTRCSGRGTVCAWRS